MRIRPSLEHSATSQVADSISDFDRLGFWHTTRSILELTYVPPRFVISGGRGTLGALALTLVVARDPSVLSRSTR